MAYLDCSVCRDRFFPFCKCPDSFDCELQNIIVCVSSDLEPVRFSSFCNFCKDRLVCPLSPFCVLGGDHFE